MFRILSSALAAGFLVSASAQAGVITVIVDDFNGTALATPGASTITVLGNPDARSPAITAGPSAGKFAIDLGTNVSGSVSLDYGNVVLPTGFTAAQVSYVVSFSNIGNNPNAANGVGNANTITVSGGAANSFLSLPTLSQPSGETASSVFAGGNLNLLFQTISTRSWDLSIDQITLTLQCAGAADATYGVTGTSSAPVSGLVSFMSSGPKSCTTSVPVPATAALTLAGLFGLGLGLRRKA